VQKVNIHDPVGQSTYFRQYEQLLIGGECYDLIGWNLDADGCCNRYGAACPGMFQGMPGTWSRRRQMVMVAPTAVRMPA